MIIIGIYLSHHLRCVNFFSDDKIEEPFFDKKNVTVVTVIGLILRHAQSCSCNGYEISELIRDVKEKAILVRFQR